MAVLIASSAVALPAAAIDTDAVVGGALGGAAGAAVGSAIGGRDGAIVGAGIGGAAGAAVATSGKEKTVKRKVVYEDDHHDHGKHKGHYKQKHHHDD
jgi:outer membrane lipoprotein SlyB